MEIFEMNATEPYTRPCPLTKNTSAMPFDNLFALFSLDESKDSIRIFDAWTIAIFLQRKYRASGAVRFSTGCEQMRKLFSINFFFPSIRSTSSQWKLDSNFHWNLLHHFILILMKMAIVFRPSQFTIPFYFRCILQNNAQ